MTTSRRLSTWKENQTQGIKQTSDSFSTPKQHHSQVYQLGSPPAGQGSKLALQQREEEPHSSLGKGVGTHGGSVGTAHEDGKVGVRLVSWRESLRD